MCTSVVSFKQRKSPDYWETAFPKPNTPHIQYCISFLSISYDEKLDPFWNIYVRGTWPLYTNPEQCHVSFGLRWMSDLPNPGIEPVSLGLGPGDTSPLSSQSPKISSNIKCSMISMDEEGLTCFAKLLLIQFSSVTQSCLTLCNSMECSMPGLPVHHQLPELAQTHVHWVGDAIQPSHPLQSPSPLWTKVHWKCRF